MCHHRVLRVWTVLLVSANVVRSYPIRGFGKMDVIHVRENVLHMRRQPQMKVIHLSILLRRKHLLLSSSSIEFVNPIDFARSLL